MSASDINQESLINSIHELAGLVQLAAGDNPAKAIAGLLRSRLNEISVECLMLADSIDSEPIETDTTVSDTVAPDTTVSDTVAPDTAVSDTEAPDTTISDTHVPDATVSNTVVPDIAVSNERETSEEKPEISRPVTAEESRNFKSPFTLNDRFLFTRELFKGDRHAFDSALKASVSMDSYEEAEDYFLYNLRLDPENPHVVKFLDIVKRLF